MTERSLILSVGEILFDVFPEYKRPGGAPFNFFYHIFRLGLNAVFLSRIGADENGAELLDFLSKRQVSTEYIQTDPDRSYRLGSGRTGSLTGFRIYDHSKRCL